MKNRYIYTWDEFYTDVDTLAKKLKGQNFQGLLIITKGGLFLGGLLAEKLQINFVETICVNSYIETQKHVLRIIKAPKYEKLPARLLIVDDVSDTGDTLKYVSEDFKAPTATLFTKKGTKCQPTFSLHEVEADTWIEFPWES